MKIALLCLIVLFGIVHAKPRCIKQIVTREKSVDITTDSSNQEENTETTTEDYTVAPDDETATELSYTENDEATTDPSATPHPVYFAVAIADNRQCPEGYSRTPSGICQKLF